MLFDDRDITVETRNKKNVIVVRNLKGELQFSRACAGLEVMLYRALEKLARPVPMLLFCPQCGAQHVDAPTATWDNPPHRTHECQACKYLWRPSNTATTGVRDEELEKYFNVDYIGPT